MNTSKAILRDIILCSIVCIPLLNALCRAQQLSIVPRPLKVEVGEGSFTLSPATVVVVKSRELQPTAKYLVDFLKPATGMTLAVKSSASSRSQAIVLLLDRSRGELGEEGYSLEVAPQVITITAAEPAGIFYGIQTLRQLLPAEVESVAKATSVTWMVPAVRIEDRPRFKWRGYLLDTVRHFRTKTEIKRYIDLLALHKLNILHLHLTDDQGWRVEIKKYPKLTKTGSRIPDFSGNKGENWFYSREDIKDLLKYAGARFVTIVPEIEMPGHSGAATASYPNLACGGQKASEVCVSLEDTFEFERNVLNEVIRLFPSRFIHVGGDEVSPESWRTCMPCKEQLERLEQAGPPADVVPVRVHLTVEAGRPYYEDTGRLQGEFMRRIDQYIASKGRRMIGWDELLEGGLRASSPARIMIWRSSQAIAAATGQRREVVVSTYPDYYLDNNEISLQRTYDYEPVPADLPPDQEKYVIGVQGNMWGETLTAIERVDWYSFPRLSAISETGWTSRAGRNFEDFADRLPSLLNRIHLLGVQFREDILPAKQ